jgi:hypothetical protein
MSTNGHKSKTKIQESLLASFRSEIKETIASDHLPEKESQSSLTAARLWKIRKGFRSALGSFRKKSMDCQLS